VANAQRPIDPVLLALNLGATFVARAFSGDKEQLVPLLKAGLAHGGFALIDVISPCVTFNDHEGSTKSYRHTRERHLDLTLVDFVPLRTEITAAISESGTRSVSMHDGSIVRFRKVHEGYDPTDRDGAYAYVRKMQDAGEVVTGLLYVEPDSADMHTEAGTVDGPLTALPFESLCPGSDALEELQREFV
jgi:2-oxoglutarate ferredoxin oxidoreductase subunit beta